MAYTASPRTRPRHGVQPRLAADSSSSRSRRRGLDQAVEEERQQPLPLPPELAKKYKHVNQLERFIGIAGWLQVKNGSRVILLPQDRLAKILGVSQPCVSGYTRLAVREKFLKKVWEASRGEHKATEYRFDVIKDPMFEQEAQRETMIAFEYGRR